MESKFEHPCPHCDFLGHYLRMDVYVCLIESPFRLIARYGNGATDYFSTRLNHFLQQIEQNPDTYYVAGTGERLPFHDYLCSQHVARCHQAWMIAFTKHGLNSVNLLGHIVNRHPLPITKACSLDDNDEPKITPWR